MAGVNYIKLFNTRLEHDFYVSGITKDLEVFPTIKTKLAMKNSNMLFKADDTGFRVLYRVDDSLTPQPFIDFKDVKLVFGVTLKNVTEFLNITTLTTLPGYAPDKVMYIKNTPSVTSASLAISFLDYLKSAIFNYEFPQDAVNAGDNGSIVITNSQGNIVTPSFPDPTQVKANTSKKWIYPIDFSNMPGGLYTFQTTGNGIQTRTVYIDNELVKKNVFAIIDLLAKDGKPANFGVNYPTSREYKLIFAKRLVQWKYIVLLKSFDPNALPTIDIFDTNTTQPVYGQINFNPAQNTTVNGIPARIITSTLAKPYYETAKTGLNIRKDPGGTPETLLANIPGVPIGLTSAQTSPTIDFNITEIFVVI